MLMWSFKGKKTEAHQTVPEETLFLIKAINPLQSLYNDYRKKEEYAYTPFKKCGNFLTMELHSNNVKIG